MSQPWADQPYALLTIPGMPGQRTSENQEILAIAIEMAHVHNVILRSLNAIYHQCEHVSTPTDTRDFVLYMKMWGDLVSHHHHAEEAEIFPKWNDIARASGATEDVTSRNLEQHRAFEHGFEDFKTYVEGINEGIAEYDGKKVKSMLEGFAPILDEHLHDEVAMILDMEKYDGVALKKVADEGAQKSIKSADPNFAIPFLFGSTDKTAPGTKNFPPVPFFMPYLNHFWFSRKYKALWRFNPCDHWGKPRPLAFVGAA